MKFSVLPVNSRVQNYSSDCIYLVSDNWNDWWEYRTLYQVYYKDERDEVTYIGSVKIGEFNMQSNQDRPNLLESFDFLEPHQFSLGQDKYYYENLNRLGDTFRDEYLTNMNDIALKPELLAKAYEERVTRQSIMREITFDTISNNFRLLAFGESQLQNYNFIYKALNVVDNSISYDINFITKPNSNPPTNLYGIIGRNGVGKSQLLRNMVKSLIDPSKNNPNIGSFDSIFPLAKDENLFENIIYISFSAFDDNGIVKNRVKKKNKVGYSYIGLKKIKKRIKQNKVIDEKIVTKSTEELRDELIKSIWMCKNVPSKNARLMNAIEMLNSDPIFSQSEIVELLESGEIENQITNNRNRKSALTQEEKEAIWLEFLAKAEPICKKFSSGHSIVLLTISNLISELEESTLVLLDEPESHLHPPLLSTFTRILSNLLVKRNGIGIIATHSPVVIQEIPSKCVWIFNRYGSHLSFEKPEIETFGENINILTREVFSYELTNSGFHRILTEAAVKYRDFDEALKSFNNELGMQAQAILRALISAEERKRNEAD